MTKKIMLTARVDPQLRQEIKVFAALQNRTMGNAIETLLREGVERAKTVPSGTARPERGEN